MFLLLSWCFVLESVILDVSYDEKGVSVSGEDEG